MAGEEFTFRPIPKIIAPDPQMIIEDPQLLSDWIYKVALEIDKIVQTDLTASNGVVLVGTDIQHADTSSIEDVSFTGVQVVSTATFDGFGHIQTLASRNLTASNGVTIVDGVFQHADTSSIANATLTGAQVLSTLTFDGFGHAQDLTTRNLTPANIGAQPVDAGLTSISGLTTAADTMIYTTASDTYATTTITAFGRSLVDDASASAARSTLGLGSIATQNSNSVAITGGSINGTIVGASTAATGEFTTLTATGETFLNLPTVSTGTSGSLWNDLGTVKVVP